MSIFDDYNQELLAKYAATKDAEREADTARVLKRRQEEIEAGLRDLAGEWIGPDPAEQDDESEDESEEDTEDEDDL